MVSFDSQPKPPNQHNPLESSIGNKTDQNKTGDQKLDDGGNKTADTALLDATPFARPQGRVQDALKTQDQALANMAPPFIRDNNPNINRPSSDVGQAKVKVAGTDGATGATRAGDHARLASNAEVRQPGDQFADVRREGEPNRGQGDSRGRIDQPQGTANAFDHNIGHTPGSQDDLRNPNTRRSVDQSVESARGVAEARARVESSSGTGGDAGPNKLAEQGIKPEQRPPVDPHARIDSNPANPNANNNRLDNPHADVMKTQQEQRRVEPTQSDSTNAHRNNQQIEPKPGEPKPDAVQQRPEQQHEEIKKAVEPTNDPRRTQAENRQPEQLLNQ